MAARPRHHRARMRRVLDHIHRHLDEPLPLERLSAVAALSKHHFHRLFAATFGLTVHQYVRLARLKRASYRLAFRCGDKITDIALDTGYGSPDSFARAFRQHFGQSASAFRDAPGAGGGHANWLAFFSSLTPAGTLGMETFATDQVRVVEVPDTTVALLRYRGHPAGLADTLRRFIALRKAAGLRPPASATFTLFHDPDPADPNDFRIDLAAATDRPVPAAVGGLEPGLIPGGRCAVLRVTGSSDDLGPAASFLFRDWLPGSGEALRNFPLYCQRVTFFPDVPEHQSITDLFLPIR